MTAHMPHLAGFTVYEHYFKGQAETTTSDLQQAISASQKLEAEAAKAAGTHKTPIDNLLGGCLLKDDVIAKLVNEESFDKDILHGAIDCDAASEYSLHQPTLTRKRELFECEPFPYSSSPPVSPIEFKNFMECQCWLISSSMLRVDCRCV